MNSAPRHTPADVMARYGIEQTKGDVMSGQDNVLEVWLDCDLGLPCLVGTLAHDRGQIRFHYERNWLTDARAFSCWFGDLMGCASPRQSRVTLKAL